MCNQSRTQRNFLTLAVRMLKREMPGIRLLVSYADLNQGHEGRIYQASNWVFVGKTGFEAGIMLNGKLTHRRTINSNTARATSGGCNIMWTRVRLGTKENRNINIYYRSMVTSSNASNSSRNLIQNAPQAETSLRQTSSLERPGKHRARRSNHESYWNASTFGGIVLF